VLSTIISSLQNSRSSLEQAKATQYSREVLEWLRHERDSIGWTAFAESMPAVGSSEVYCLTSMPNGIPALDTMQGACEAEERITDTIYTRQLTITRTNTSQIDTEVAVSRPDSTGTVTSRTNMTLAEWQ